MEIRLTRCEYLWIRHFLCSHVVVKRFKVLFLEGVRIRWQCANVIAVQLFAFHFSGCTYLGEWGGTLWSGFNLLYFRWNFLQVSANKLYNWQSFNEQLFSRWFALVKESMDELHINNPFSALRLVYRMGLETKGFFGLLILLRLYVENFTAPFIAVYRNDHHYFKDHPPQLYPSVIVITIWGWCQNKVPQDH